jgi:hypothetical protein
MANFDLFRISAALSPGNAAVRESTGGHARGQRIGRTKGSVLESPPSTGKAWPLT